MWDVLVIGGGPSGSAAALSLRQRGARVLLVERSLARSAHPGEALLGDAAACLDELGMREAFRELESRPSYLHRIHWGGRALLRPALATSSGATYHLDRVAFDELMLAACEQRKVTVKRGLTLARLVCTGGRAIADLSEAGLVQTMEFAYVIDATGRSAQVCRRLAAIRERADGLLAFCATFERGDCEPSTLVESSANGWWYSAPRPHGMMTALYATDLTQARGQRPEALWDSALGLTQATHARLAGRVRRSAIRGHRAGPEWTRFDADLPVLPVGDAALSFDPLSGEGLCFALRSGIEAANAVGSVSQRRAYQRGTRRLYESHLRLREASYALERALRESRFWQTPRGTLAP